MNEGKPRTDQTTPTSERNLGWFCASFCFLCAVFWVLCTFLLLSIIFVVLKIPLGIQPISLGSLIVLIYHKISFPLIVYFAGIFRSLFPWPAVAILVVVLIVWGPDRIAELISRIGKLELPGGIKFEGRAPPPKEFQKELGEAARIVEKANKAIGEAYEGAKSFAADLRERNDIPRLVSELAVQVAQKIGAPCPDDYRLTLYVPDFIFSDRLFQFTEYYNKKGERISADRAGRTFSIRYGIIGRVWRSGIHEIEGNLIPPQERAEAEGDIERFIARRWGLTLKEAVQIRQYNSYAALRLQKADQTVGVLYFDSKAKDAFGDTKALLSAILALLQEGSLVEKLLEISSEVAPWSGRIQIYRNP